MSDGLNDLLGGLNDDAPATGAGGQLRAQLEALAAKNRELTESLAQFQAEKRESTVASLLAKHAIPEVARDLFPKDAELTDESATAFVQKYGALWGASAETATTPAPQQAAATSIQTFAAQAATPVAAPLSEDDYRAQFAAAQTKDEFLRMLATAGATAG